jgi:hypothetical protein
LLDAALQPHWLPGSGRITRVSLGPGPAAARAQLQVGAGGAGFLDLAVDEVRPEMALDLSALPRRQRIVAVGPRGGAALRARRTRELDARDAARHDPILIAGPLA